MYQLEKVTAYIHLVIFLYLVLMNKECDIMVDGHNAEMKEPSLTSFLPSQLISLCDITKVNCSHIIAVYNDHIPDFDSHELQYHLY